MAKKYMSNSVDKPFEVETKVTNIIEFNNIVNEKYKTVFECESKSGNPRMCVYWNKTSVQVDDMVKLTGRLKNGVFLVWSMLILNRKAKINECK